MHRRVKIKRNMIAYWPHAGIAAGIVLNVAGLLASSADLIAVGTNALTISAGFLLQRRQNTTRDA